MLHDIHVEQQYGHTLVLDFALRVAGFPSVVTYTDG